MLDDCISKHSINKKRKKKLSLRGVFKQKRGESGRGRKEGDSPS